MTARQKRQLLKALVSLLIALISALVYKLQGTTPVLQDKTDNSINAPGTYKVTDFADGDTITVDMQGKPERIRFIGVDTPETHDPRKAVQCFGLAAAEFTRKTIGSNRVRLEADPDTTNRDRYNRLLRYVYLPDGTLVNAEIIKQGYGFAYTSFPFSKSREFQAYETQARQAGKGLWASCSPTLDKGTLRANDAVQQPVSPER